MQNNVGLSGTAVLSGDAARAVLRAPVPRGTLPRSHVACAARNTLRPEPWQCRERNRRADFVWPAIGGSVRGRPS